MASWDRRDVSYFVEEVVARRFSSQQLRNTQPPAELRTVEDDYAAGKTRGAISESLGISDWQLSHVLEDIGVPLRAAHRFMQPGAAAEIEANRDADGVDENRS